MENKILTKDNVEETEKDKPVDSPKVTENQSEDKKVKIGKAKKKIFIFLIILKRMTECFRFPIRYRMIL